MMSKNNDAEVVGSAVGHTLVEATNARGEVVKVVKIVGPDGEQITRIYLGVGLVA